MRAVLVGVIALAIMGNVGAGVAVLAHSDVPATQAIQPILDRRAQAVQQNDKAAFLAEVDAAWRPAQSRLFDNLVRLPLAEWTYRAIGEPSPGVFRLHLRHRLRGFDPRTITQYVALRRGTLAPAIGLKDDPEVWDGRPVQVSQHGSALIISEDRDPADLAALTSAGIEAVTRIWGPWSQRAIVLVPATDERASALAGMALTQRDLAATATGDRVVLAPRAFGKLSPQGRRIVLTHELTHVATRDVTQKHAWLEEGFADYVAFRAYPMATKVAAQELATEVRAGRVPKHLPAQIRSAQDYAGAWLACRMIAERWGEQELVRVYREGGVTVPGFTSMWRDYLRGELT